MQALLLPLGDDLYAVEMRHAREVIAFPELTSLPSAPVSVLGVCNVRGEIVPVFAASRLLGLRVDAPLTHLAIVETRSGPAGLGLTAVGSSVVLDEMIELTETPGTLGSRRFGDRVVVLIDPDMLLSAGGEVE